MIKNKEAIKEYGKRYPHKAEMIIAELKSEEFFNELKPYLISKQEAIFKEIFLKDQTPLTLYSQISNKSNTFLLESVEGGDQWAQFSIIGFDGIDVGQLISPRLTTIRQDTTRLGKLAANQILQMINDKTKKRIHEPIIVDTFLITGETTRVNR